MDLPLLGLIVAINFRTLSLKKRTCLFILEQTTFNIQGLAVDFNLNIVNSVSIILLSLFKGE